jgi:uncharacterized protein with FMN-binding domain
MRRAPWYLAAGAIAGFAGVIGLHSRAAPAGLAAAGGTAGHSQPSHQPVAAGSQGGGAAASGQSGQAAPAGTHSATGPTEQYGFGELAVRVTVRGSRITNLTVPVLQANEQYSQMLAERAIPELKSQVLAADSASIDGVSGATFTSQAYEQSVQAALDKLHVK